jgi:hypothetical protein
MSEHVKLICEGKHRYSLEHQFGNQSTFEQINEELQFLYLGEFQQQDNAKILHGYPNIFDIFDHKCS